MQNSALFSTVKLPVIFILFSLICACNQSNQDTEDFASPQDEIRTVLYKQQEAWNNGDIAEFMKGYWKSPDLRFSGSSGLTKGWQATIDRYYKAYPDRSAMGKLKFEVMDFRLVSDNVALMNGKYTLYRSNDEPSGYFTLVWEKIDNQWLITADHTS